MRGERRQTHGACSWRSGSSPHARGTRCHAEPIFPRNRFIPACAGNASVVPTSARSWSVHPRMRGERMDALILSQVARGSSPHARGTHGCVDDVALRRRFIPACAGNACQCQRPGCRLPVHPRMRGERVSTWADCDRVAGSSPHARGTRFAAAHNVPLCLFIPACAGNAFRRVPASGLTTVHPRMRGERTSNKSLIYQRKINPSDSTKLPDC